MIKKCFLVLVLLGMIAGGVFAQAEPEPEQEAGQESKFKNSFSIGAGGYFTNDFGGGFVESGYPAPTPYIGGGALVYVDTRFAKLSLGALSAKGGTFDNGAQTVTERDLYGLDIGLYGKFPFQLGERFTFFPLLGIDYRLILSAADGYGDQYPKNAPLTQKSPWDLSAFWLKLGAGLDFALNEILYLRGEALYGARLWNKYEEGHDKPIFGHGVTINLSLGYRFN